MININSTLENRYQIMDLLGEGGSGKTYRALDIQGHIEVAIKVLSLRGMGDWKILELFEREVKILTQLAHPAIPQYLDYFRTEVAGEEAFCLVQAIAPGRSLTSWIESGYAFSESELQDIATQILKILSYLQTFMPPIIHRDLKPQNLLWSESGEVYLVDFGAVRDTYHLTVTGCSTIVGTCGYMAPEQFRGQAVLATDLYGLGATLLYLKSGQDPADLPVKQMKIDFRERVQFSPDFANWVERLLEPIPEDRYRNADRALNYLHGKVAIKIPRPQQPIVRISYRDEDMKIVIPPIWLATRSSKVTFVSATSLLLMAIGGWWLMRVAVLPQILELILLLMGIVLIPWMLWILGCYFISIACQHELEMVDRQVICKTKFAGVLLQKYVVKLEEIRNISCQKVGMLRSTGEIKLTIYGGSDRYKEFKYRQFNFLHLYTFARHLDAIEQRWLMEEMSEYLDFFVLKITFSNNAIYSLPAQRV
jgi:eukaryotic-like serine/threonine-protein kinase